MTGSKRNTLRFSDLKESKENILPKSTMNLIDFLSSKNPEFLDKLDVEVNLSNHNLPDLGGGHTQTDLDTKKTEILVQAGSKDMANRVALHEVMHAIDHHEFPSRLKRIGSAIENKEVDVEDLALPISFVKGTPPKKLGQIASDYISFDKPKIFEDISNRLEDIRKDMVKHLSKDYAKEIREFRELYKVNELYSYLATTSDKGITKIDTEDTRIQQDLKFDKPLSERKKVLGLTLLDIGVPSKLVDEVLRDVK